MTYIPEALRRTVLARAKNCCEYCLIPQESKLFTFELDHIIAEKHRGATREDILCFICLNCNRPKGRDFASFDPQPKPLPFLFIPPRDQWYKLFNFHAAVFQLLQVQDH